MFKIITKYCLLFILLLVFTQSVVAMHSMLMTFLKEAMPYRVNTYRYSSGDRDNMHLVSRRFFKFEGLPLFSEHKNDKILAEDIEFLEGINKHYLRIIFEVFGKKLLDTYYEYSSENLYVRMPCVCNSLEETTKETGFHFSCQEKISMVPRKMERLCNALFYAQKIDKSPSKKKGQLCMFKEKLLKNPTFQIPINCKSCDIIALLIGQERVCNEKLSNLVSGFIRNHEKTLKHDCLFPVHDMSSIVGEYLHVALHKRDYIPIKDTVGIYIFDEQKKFTETYLNGSDLEHLFGIERRLSSYVI